MENGGPVRSCRQAAVNRAKRRADLNPQAPCQCVQAGTGPPRRREMNATAKTMNATALLPPDKVRNHGISSGAMIAATTASRGCTGGGAAQTRRIDFRSHRVQHAPSAKVDADSNMPKPSTAATEPAWEKANAATADTARNTLRVFLRPQISTSHAARK